MNFHVITKAIVLSMPFFYQTNDIKLPKIVDLQNLLFARVILQVCAGL